MTEPDPDPDATLAAQVAHLRGELSRYAGEVGGLRARMEEFTGRDMAQLLEIKKLGEKLDEALTRHQATDPPAPFWRGLDREGHAARLAELRDWVERFARVEYPGYLAKLPPCWPNHREALWELSNLMTEWVRVYGDPDNRDLQAALWWHERWLPGAIQRLGQAIRCDATGCSLARSSPYERSPPRYP
jgi:hypothetical protein